MIQIISTHGMTGGGGETLKDHRRTVATFALTPDTVSARGAGSVIAARGIQIDGQGRATLIASRCADCDARAWPPAKLCHACLSDRIEELRLGTQGRLYAFTEIQIAPASRQTPYTVGYIDMPEGVRIFAHLDGSASDFDPDCKVVLHARKLGEEPVFSFTKEDKER